MNHRHDPGSPECRKIFAQLSEYLDEELDPSLCDKIERHNVDCPPCAAFVESLRRTIELIRDPDVATLPEASKRSIVREYGKISRALDEADGRAD